MAKPAPIPMMPVSYSWNAFMWLCCSKGSVVQVWPRGGTYCRSSSQIAHWAGGCALSGYCMPQAVQMKRGMGHIPSLPMRCIVWVPTPFAKRGAVAAGTFDSLVK
jgi:hypothetical protein